MHLLPPSIKEICEMAVHRWGEFGEVAVRMMGQVKPGENLLVLADTWTDMDIAEACLIAGINAKADAQLLVIQRMSHTDTSELGAPTVGAIAGADLVIGVCETMFVEKASTRQACANGTRIVSVMPRGQEDFVIEGILDVDYAQMINVAEKVCKLWERTDVCHVTSPLGTDISFRLKGRPALVGDGMATEPGQVGFIPGGSAGIAPVEETINGTIVIDGCIEPGSRLVSAHITCHLEKGVITAIEGGADANAWRSDMESVDDPKAFHLCHFTLGLNPRAKASDSMHQCEHVLGAVTFGLGDQAPSFKGTVGAAKIHADVVLMSPTVYLDGVVMCDNNKLNPDLGLGGL
jgi:leucyl aminopeptidase (aminopeptidase T)